MIAVLKEQYVNTDHMVDILEWKGTSASRNAVILDWAETSAASKGCHHPRLKRRVNSLRDVILD